MTYLAEAPSPSADGYRTLAVGDPAPWFVQACTSNPRFVFDAAAGRYIVLCFLMSAGTDAGQRALSFISANRSRFDDDTVAFFGVTIDWRDQSEGRLREQLPGVRFFWDFDLSICRRYGAVPVDAAPGAIRVRRLWFVLDPTLRIRAIVPFERDAADHAALRDVLARLPPLDDPGRIQAPVLSLPDVFEPAFCRELVTLHRARGGVETGAILQIAGRTVTVHDPTHKRRVDCMIEDPATIAQVEERIRRRVVPEIRKAYQFEATRLERYLIGCYRARDGGHFAAHRDNTTPRTAHRRFALTIHLNDDFEGGELSFPEYGSRPYKPTVGGAVAFSCSLLHAVSPVTSGERYALLPFLHDEAAERQMAQQGDDAAPHP